MKTIVILSPDAWGIMKVSKMHFAVELAGRGHKVYFVNPPRALKDRRLCWVEEIPQIDNLSVIHLNENRWRIAAREKFLPLYKIIEAQFIKSIKTITGQADEVWNFNPQVFMSAHKFRAQKNMLFMYDLFAVKAIGKAAAKSDMIFSVAENILDNFKTVTTQKVLLNHGLASAFENAMNGNYEKASDNTTRIGYIGNLFRQGIDRQAFLEIIKQHPGVEFHVWGPSSFEHNNLSSHDASDATKQFIERLQSQSNVIMHGIVRPDQLAKEIQLMDAFLFLYDRAADINQASNAHKIMEYLSTGKTVIAMHVSHYAGKDLLLMDDVESKSFSAFFSTAIKNLNLHNDRAKRDRRRAFALSNTYARLVDQIEKETRIMEAVS